MIKTPLSTQPLLTISNVSKKFDQHLALAPINLTIYSGEFLTLLGPSGCGKTTLLRLLSGFEKPDTGSLKLNSSDITQTPPEDRQINMVFQSYALFPHMTVYQNIAFGLHCEKCSRHTIKERVTAVLARVKLTALAERKPHQLSGGQQQRVAIARALVKEPQVLLLDEPLSALDYSLRKTMRIELKALQRRLGIAFVLVTHDQEEALMLSDRIVVMNDGKIEQIGAPRDVYEEPKNLFVTEFIGEANIFRTTVTHTHDNQLTVNIAEKSFSFSNDQNFKVGDQINIVVRPEDMDAWDKEELENIQDMLQGTVHEVIYKGSTVDLIIKLTNNQLVAISEFFDEDDENLEYAIGDHVYVNWTAGWEVILADETT